MVLRLLQLLLILAVIRAVWRLAKGVLEGAGYTRVDGPRQVGVKLERDPVCGTYVSPTKAPALRTGGRTIYFCSDKCRREWERR
jgi:YHS domain-containing protein